MSEADSIITVLPDMSLAERIAADCYEYVGSSIDEAMFPQDPTAVGDCKFSFYELNQYMSTEEVVAVVHTGRRQAAKLEHGLAYGAAHPDEPQNGVFLMLGSVCERGGEFYSPGLCGLGNGRRGLDLFSLCDEFAPGVRFLCVEPVDSTT